MTDESRTTLCSKCRNPFMLKPRVNSDGPSNSVLSPHEMRELILLSEKDFDDYDAEIARLQSQLISVREQRKRLDDYNTQLRSLLSSFREIPNEILCIIFEWACTDNLLQEYPWPLDSEPPTQLSLPFIAYLPALAISAVCTRWRSLALSSPGIWSQFRLEISPIASKAETMSNARSGFISTLQLYLDRSANSPLMIDLQTPTGARNDQSKPSVLGLLLDHSSRWKTFSYTGDYALEKCGLSSFPVLEDLILKGSGDNIRKADLDCFEHAPKLRGVRTDFFKKYSVLPWNQLASLDVRAPRGEQMDLLRRCSCLTALKLRSFWSKSRPSSVSLATLKSFTIVNSVDKPKTELLETILFSFTLPSLGELIIYSEDRSAANRVIWPSDTFSAFISRSSCTLTTFSLSSVTISDLDLIASLNHLPSLINFSVDGLMNPEGGSPLTSYFLSSLTLHDSGSLLLPKLRFLSIKFHDTSFDDAAFVRMVSSRWLPDPAYAAAIGMDCLRMGMQVVIIGSGSNVIKIQGS
ncbi:hypothetical protein BT96DRAFT_627294 [Gymnopus androsaceus JB14]|uniref:Uncharacterized protein n=1 Tax=Gymnopus androsaceus JB14 TaxID=1447944 RepID=A0A6A4IK94_9AGAR|nr:hypothetical protein BT96DRAFT_627294 [Gymnopus androsaceus JB14]